MFADRTEVPVVHHDEREESADEVLEEMLSQGRPVLIMGNTVAGFMRDMEEAIETRVEGATTTPATDRFPNELAIVGGTDENPARFRFSVEGVAVGDVESGVPEIGSRIDGTVAGDREVFRFRGDLSGLRIDGEARAYLNGERLSPERVADAPADE